MLCRRARMPRVLCVTPSRGRPDRLGVMLTEARKHSRTELDIAVCLDHDDPRRPDYILLAQKHGQDMHILWHFGPRQSLTDWTNSVVKEHSGYDAYASLGDDHVPGSAGWDAELLGELDRMSGGFAYANDMHQGRLLPTAVMASANVVGALGWLAYPGCKHYFIDQIWKELGEEAGCLAYRQDVIVEHQHPMWSTPPTWLQRTRTPGTDLIRGDATYEEAAAAHWDADAGAYASWRETKKGKDAETVRGAVSTVAGRT